MNRKAIDVVRDDINGKMMADFMELRAISYSYLIFDGSENKNAKDTQKCVMRIKFSFKDFKPFY